MKKEQLRFLGPNEFFKEFTERTMGSLMPKITRTRDGRYPAQNVFCIMRIEEFVRHIKFPIPPGRSTVYEFCWLKKGKMVRTDTLKQYVIGKDMIFSKRRTKYGYELQLRSAKLTTEKLTRDYQYDVTSTTTNLQNDQKDLDNQRNNLDNANELYRIDADRLQKGSIKETDLLGTYYTLQQAQNNYLNAIYTFLLDMIQYRKAAGVAIN